MYKIVSLLICFIISSISNAQIDTVTFNLDATHLFPSTPIKSSYTSVFDKRNGFDYVYSANMESGLGIYDVSIPNTINTVVDVGISNFNGLDVSTVEQRGNLLFVGIGDFQVNSNLSSGLAIVDITNPSIPTIIDSWDSTLFQHGISHILINGNFAYLSTMTDGIIILDISDENNIQFKSTLQLDLNFPSPSSNAHNARGLKLLNDTLYVCFDRGGLRLIDVSDKSNPIEVYQYINSSLNSQAAAAYNDIYINGNYAYISVDYCGLEVIDISSIPFTSVQWYNPWGCNGFNWSGSAIHTNELISANNDSLLFVSAGQSELLVFDISNPSTATKIGEYVFLNDTLATHGLDVWNDRVVLSFIHTPVHIPPLTPFYADPGGLKILDYHISSSSASVTDYTMQDETLILYQDPQQNDKIELKCESEFIHIYGFNAIGELIFNNNNIHSSNHTIDLETLQSGLYFLSILTEKGPFLRKIIVK